MGEWFRRTTGTKPTKQQHYSSSLSASIQAKSADSKQILFDRVGRGLARRLNACHSLGNDACPFVPSGISTFVSFACYAEILSVAERIMWRRLILWVMCCACMLNASAAENTSEAKPSVATRVATRIAEIQSDKAPLPTDMATLYDLIRAIDTEFNDWRKQAELLNREKESAPDLEAMRGRIINLFGDISNLDCHSVSRDRITSYASQLRENYRAVAQVILTNQYQVAGASELTDAASKSDATCEGLKALVGDAKRQDAGVDMFNAMIVQRDNAIKQIEETLAQIDKLNNLLQQRKWNVQTAIAQKSAQQQLSGSLWKVISVIGLFSIGAIFVVRLFSVPLQMEWVATGQVIQFVTVMILLSVLMALGLAGILEQNILGTLLGGIAGHVLAQGVGRSAAHEANRKNVSNEAGASSQAAGDDPTAQPTSPAG